MKKGTAEPVAGRFCCKDRVIDHYPGGGWQETGTILNVVDDGGDAYSSSTKAKNTSSLLPSSTAICFATYVGDAATAGSSVEMAGQDMSEWDVLRAERFASEWELLVGCPLADHDRLELESVIDWWTHLPKVDKTKQMQDRLIAKLALAFQSCQSQG